MSAFTVGPICGLYLIGICVFGPDCLINSVYARGDGYNLCKLYPNV